MLEIFKVFYFPGESNFFSLHKTSTLTNSPKKGKFPMFLLYRYGFGFTCNICVTIVGLILGILVYEESKKLVFILINSIKVSSSDFLGEVLH